MNWKDKLKEDPIPWLLEPDISQPAIRYFTLHDILERPEDDGELQAARAEIMRTGPVPDILAAQEPEGYWYKPGPGYSPKYRSTVWQVIFLAQLGADGTDTRVRKGCEYLLTHTIAGHGGFAFNGIPSGFIHCLSGNLIAALIDLGFIDDHRVQSALEWEARTITGDGVANTKSQNTIEHYYAYTPGPIFSCGPNAGLPCAWGAVKAMLALGKVPESARNDRITNAIEKGIDFLLSYDVATANYPFGFGGKPSSSWFKVPGSGICIN
ncbi:nitrogen fixation protein NifH [Chloroflexota bacterium]